MSNTKRSTHRTGAGRRISNACASCWCPKRALGLRWCAPAKLAIASISPEAIQEVESAGLKLISVPGTMQAVYELWGTYRPENKDSPLADKRVRQALSLAIDRQQVIDHVMYGKASWPLPWALYPYSVDSDIERWTNWSREALRYDPKRAKELLAEAGYPDGFEMKFANTALPGTPFMVQVGEVLADFWTKIGIKVKLKHYEWGAFQPIYRGNQDAISGGGSMFRTAGRPIAAPRYSSAFTSKSRIHHFGDKNDLCDDFCKAYDALQVQVATEKLIPLSASS